MKYIIENCPSYRNYNVFGAIDKPCCYNYFDYCENIEDCPIKQVVQKCLQPTFIPEVDDFKEDILNTLNVKSI